MYLTGTFLRFSNSNEGSTANSLPAAFLKALVHLAFLGFLFFLNALWHFDRQNLKIYKIIVLSLIVFYQLHWRTNQFNKTSGGIIPSTVKSEKSCFRKPDLMVTHINKKIYFKKNWSWIKELKILLLATAILAAILFDKVN